MTHSITTKSEEDGGWRPISTAPKDGTVIDVWLHGEYSARFTDVYWGRPQHECGEAGRYCDCCPTYDGWVMSAYNQYLTGDEGQSDEPIAWMPLPKAPNA